MIVLDGINKSFKVYKRQSGLRRAVKALVSREHETIQALKDVSFSIGEGEMVGYIGPNGAGKSTTIKIMCGVLTPDSGMCEIDGRVPWKERVAHVKHIGVVFGQRSQLWWDVPVCDSFELIRDIYKVNQAEYQRALDELTVLLGLSELLKTPARSLSLGQRMRCELAASLLHSPKILFLDEPTIGLDAVSKLAVRQFIQKLNREKGTTVILTTHDMQDIEALTKRILLIGKGRILLDGGLEEIKKRFSDEKTLVVEYTGSLGEPLVGMRYEKSEQGRLIAVITSGILDVPTAIAHLAKSVEITDISVSGISSEEMVARLYEEYHI